ncbi:MAG: hypothetical protein ACK56F_26015, partial [bacterium]
DQPVKISTLNVVRIIEGVLYGVLNDAVPSGSLDTCIKLWDTRRKAVLCIRNDFLSQTPLFKTFRTRIRPKERK